MVKVLFHRSFERAYRRKVIPGTDRHKRFRTRVQQFIDNPFDPALKTHKLHGKLQGYLSFSIEYDLRVIFYFEDDETVVFVDLGTHDEVY